ncbi:hypothetical protein GE061_019517 [Apolygus lucorum]|uniref:Xaa-Pro dipeptidase n=1 Tax=Apolygus lucorum TaxID=248454 RepID=A0A6A4JA74_APOLU|nr:hypothetical protein GE061_019517 [Apolygus lucorum]
MAQAQATTCSAIADRRDDVWNVQLPRSAYELNTQTFKVNRERLIEKIKTTHPTSLIVLQGAKDISQGNTDTDYLFRQESFFLWAFGVQEPGYWGLIDVKAAKSYLLIPRLPDSYKVWMGELPCPNKTGEKYLVDQVFYDDELEAKISEINPSEVLVLSGVNSDSSIPFATPKLKNENGIKIDTEILYSTMEELRVIKTDLELELLRNVNKISSYAHRLVMKKIAANTYEYQGEALFKFFAQYVGGCRAVAYTCICGSGHNGSILHYGHAAAPNAKLIEDGDMCLFDMGAALFGYASDITISFPVNGRFTEKQRKIYNVVLESRNAAFRTVKPGVMWMDVHKAALKELLKGLQNIGILVAGKNLDEMMAKSVSATFQPHGLGHLMGIDVHDCGGYNKFTPPRSGEPHLRALRTARELKAGMVLTVEPGCYFIPCLIEQAKNDPQISGYINFEVVKDYAGFGGVRIEDDIIVTSDGMELMTDVPRTVQEIEQFMAK